MIEISFGVLPWTRHVRAARDLLRRAFEAANKIGDLTFATRSLYHLNTILLAAGDSLVEVQREAEHGLEFAQRARFGLIIDIITPQLGLIRILRGLTPKFGCFDDGEFDELRFEDHLSSPLCKYIGVWYGLGKVIGVFYPYAGKDETVIRAVQESLGTADLTEDYKNIPWRALAYRTEDYKYRVLVIDAWGTFIGSRQFIEDIIAPIFQDLYRAWQAAEAAKATSPSPTPTPD